MWTKSQTLILAAASVSAIGLAGCGHYGVAATYRDDGYAEPQYIEVPEAPPAVIVETPSYSPGPDYLWIDGYWHWGGNRYDWHHGEWQRPTSQNHVWIRPSYERHENAYRYAPGRWAEGKHEAVRNPAHR